MEEKQRDYIKSEGFSPRNLLFESYLSSSAECTQLGIYCLVDYYINRVRYDHCAQRAV